MERETGFEPATSTLARLHSTTELFPLARFYIPAAAFDVKEKSPGNSWNQVFYSEFPLIANEQTSNQSGW
jgi:hypothetical protein